MATLNSIAENIAFSLGQQFNDTLMESIKDSIIDYRALLIRQDLDNKVDIEIKSLKSQIKTNDKSLKQTKDTFKKDKKRFWIGIVASITIALKAEIYLLIKSIFKTFSN